MELQNKVGVAKRKLGGHRQTRDLRDTYATTWKEAEELAIDRAEWHQCVSQCIHQDDLLTYKISTSYRNNEVVIHPCGRQAAWLRAGVGFRF